MPRNPKAPDAAPERASARPLDDLDRRILTQLQEDASVSSAELARRVELSAAGLQKRVRKLQEAGVIQHQVAILNREAIGLDLLCFVQVTLAHHQPDAVRGFRQAIQGMAAVLECHHLTGEFDYLLKVVVANHRELEHFLVDELTPAPGVDRIRTSIVLNDIKASTALPLGGGP
ncbi:MAG TPA: Lrp/AsnC family transcriptional regulator [Longimicrobiales bacterium]|nr:Lrp/AsnC family transcriptional regulator [Longimicrobiales bacterium]